MSQHPNRNLTVPATPTASSAPPGMHPIDPDHVQRLREAGQPLFALGTVFATPAVLEHLTQHGYLPNALLGRHVHGDYGQLCPEDQHANDRAVREGERILSSYQVEGETVYVLTDAVKEDGLRHATALMLACEY